MKPLVGIVLGSAFDWETMKAAAKVLEEFGVAYEATAMSAHRTPKAVVAWTEAAAANGMNAIIAAGGGAAHLAGSASSPRSGWCCSSSRSVWNPTSRIC